MRPSRYPQRRTRLFFVLARGRAELEEPTVARLRAVAVAGAALEVAGELPGGGQLGGERERPLDASGGGGVLAAAQEPRRLRELVARGHDRARGRGVGRRIGGERRAPRARRVALQLVAEVERAKRA